MLSIIVSAYDGSLHGWQSDDWYNNLSLSFAYKAHESCIRCLDCKNQFLVSASTDESIQLYDIMKKKVLDKMSGAHTDEITAFAFAQNPKIENSEIFLLTGDAKGHIFVWTIKESKVIHELKGHKQNSPVTSISVHPTGKIALSTAKDNSLRMWDLIQAKAAPRTKLDDFQTLSCCCWSPIDGARYALVGNDIAVLIFDSESSEVPIGTFIHPKRVNSLQFAQDVVLCSACDDGMIRIIGADGSLIRSFSSETKCRARSVAAISRIIMNEEDEKEETIVAGAFSDGTVRIWDLDKDTDEPVQSLNVGTSAHVTSLVMSFVEDKKNIVKQQKKLKIDKKKQQEEEE